MITQTTTQTETYFATKISALDCDGEPASIEITASIGEFDGVVVETRAWGAYTNAELNLAELDEAIAALTAARAYLTR